MNGVYFEYKLIDSNQGWKCKWFYTDNQRPQLPKPSMYAPVHSDIWNTEPSTEECLQVPELLQRIAELKKAGLTAERVAFSFMKRRIQPLMKRHHYGYEYTSSDDDSRFTNEEISSDAVMERVNKIFQNMPSGAL